MFQRKDPDQSGVRPSDRRAGLWLLVAGSLLALVAGCTAAAAPAPVSAPTTAAPTAASHDAHEAATATPEPTVPAAAPTPSISGDLPAVPLASGDRERGERLFQSAGCSGCHTLKGAGGQVGPDLTEVGKRAPSRAAAQGLAQPELYFVQSIVYPNAYVVEGFFPVMLDWKQMQLNEQDLADLASFLKDLNGE